MKIVTFNLRHNADRWAERFPMVVDTLVASDADLIGLQEVSLKLGAKNQAEIIMDAMNKKLGREGYQVYFRACRGTQEENEGIAILSRLPVKQVSSIALPGIWRVALLAELEIEGHQIGFVDTHLHHEPQMDESIRFPQAEKVLAWANSQAFPCIIVGDFNARPDSSTILMLKQQVHSAYESIHGVEPDHTWPTPLVSGFAPEDLGMIDYVFYPESAFKVMGCEVIGTEAAPTDDSLYASDHYGIAAEFQILV